MAVLINNHYFNFPFLRIFFLKLHVLASTKCLPTFHETTKNNVFYKSGVKKLYNLDSINFTYLSMKKHSHVESVNYFIPLSFFILQVILNSLFTFHTVERFSGHSSVDI